MMAACWMTQEHSRHCDTPPSLIGGWRFGGHIPTLRFPRRTSNQHVAVIARRPVHRHTDGSANLVEFCPAEPFSTLSLIRGYRPARRDGGLLC
jgi:hypothetical protein